MDGIDDGGVTAPDVEAAGAALAEALNSQVLPQLALLAHGALAMGTAHAVQAAAQHEQPATATVLELRLLYNGHIYALAVQVVASP